MVFIFYSLFCHVDAENITLVVYVFLLFVWLASVILRSSEWQNNELKNSNFSQLVFMFYFFSFCHVDAGKITFVVYVFLFFHCGNSSQLRLTILSLIIVCWPKQTYKFSLKDRMVVKRLVKGNKEFVVWVFFLIGVG